MTEPAFQVALLKVPVTDVRRSSAFYRDALGFEELFVAEEYGWAQMRAGDLPFGLYQPGLGGGDATIGGSVGFHLSVDGPQFDALVERLIPQGVVVDNQIHHGDDGSRFFDLRDPDGNTLKIVRTNAAATI